MQVVAVVLPEVVPVDVVDEADEVVLAEVLLAREAVPRLSL